jgi:hypothetical protein
MVNELLGQSFSAIAPFLWVVFLVLILKILKDFWMTRITANYIRGMDWITLEIDMPGQNEKSMKSMEQVFATLYALYSFGFRWWEKNIEGMVEKWVSLELEGTQRS